MARRPITAIARRPAGTLPFENSDKDFENSWSRRLIETGWIFFIARSMLMPFASAYTYARSSVSFSAMTR